MSLGRNGLCAIAYRDDAGEYYSAVEAIQRAMQSTAGPVAMLLDAGERGDTMLAMQRGTCWEFLSAWRIIEHVK
jgi:hypothetical protein